MEILIDLIQICHISETQNDKIDQADIIHISKPQQHDVNQNNSGL